MISENGVTLSFDARKISIEGDYGILTFTDIGTDKREIVVNKDFVGYKKCPHNNDPEFVENVFVLALVDNDKFIVPETEPFEYLFDNFSDNMAKLVLRQIVDDLRNG